MIVQIDGKEVKVENDIKIIWNDTLEDNQELHLTGTYEGIILDIFENECLIATMSLDTEQLCEECI